MSNSANVLVNDVVEFQYNGGSHPGSTRVVKVNNVNQNSFNGYDVYAEKANSFRNFDLNKVINLKVVYRPVAPENSAKFDPSAGVVLKRKNGDTLSLSYNNSTLSVSYHKNGTSSVSDKNIVFGLPTNQDVFVDGVVEAFREFSR